jgi:hypothetical protein
MPPRLHFPLHLRAFPSRNRAPIPSRIPNINLHDCSKCHSQLRLPGAASLFTGSLFTSQLSKAPLRNHHAPATPLLCFPMQSYVLKSRQRVARGHIYRGTSQTPCAKTCQTPKKAMQSYLLDIGNPPQSPKYRTWRPHLQIAGHRIRPIHGILPKNSILRLSPRLVTCFS